MSRKSRNQRMAVSLTKITDLNEEQAYKKIQMLSGLRGKSAHSTEKVENEVKDALCFIQNILEKHLNS